MQPLTVQTIQADLTWEDPATNLQHFDQLLSSTSVEADLIILPEMFSTGFTMQPEKVAHHAPATIEWMKEKAREKNAVLTGSIVVETEGRYYNRLIWMTPEGSFDHYDKKYLFCLAGEDKHYSPGEKLQLFQWKGWKICPLICYDLRFPEWSRNTKDYDLLIYVASWPEKRIEAWKTLLQARAIENQSYTIGVNRVGKDENGHAYSGDSCVVDFGGAVIYQITKLEQVGTVTLDYQAQQLFRRKLPYLKDQIPFEIKGSLNVNNTNFLPACVFK